ADGPGLSLLAIDVKDDPAGVGNEGAAQLVSDVLEVGPSAEDILARSPAASFSAADVVGAAHSAVRVNAGSKDSELLARVTRSEDQRHERGSEVMVVELFKGLAIGGKAADSFLGSPHLWQVQCPVEELLQ